MRIRSSRVLLSYLHAKAPSVGGAYVMTDGSDGVGWPLTPISSYWVDLILTSHFSHNSTLLPHEDFSKLIKSLGIEHYRLGAKLNCYQGLCFCRGSGVAYFDDAPDFCHARMFFLLWGRSLARKVNADT